MNQPVLLAVAHGSRYPQAAATIAALAVQVERLAPVIDVRVAFVQHAEPSLSDALATTGPDVVIVPLLLSSGYHLAADIGSAAPARIAGPLGPDPLLTTALTARLEQAGVPAGTPVVLAAAGSSDPLAAAQVREQADLLAKELGADVTVAFAAAGRPSVPRAVADLRARTGGPVAVATYLLAPGQFHDALAQAGADWVTEPLGDHPAIAALVIDRYRVRRAA
jgi:sirohydrochlorin ferrochelatase